MELAMIGLGRMGANMAERLLKGGHRVVGYARHADKVQNMEKKGMVGAYSLEQLASYLTPHRIIWLMIPAGKPIDLTIQALLPLLDREDIIIDGGNSYYKNTLRRASFLREKGIQLVDVGTSGGIWGFSKGYSMMIGGERKVVVSLRPIFETLAPAADRGWAYVGPSGAGHFVKMVHNGIEYGLMESYAEGFALLKRKEEFKLDLHQIAEVWRYGSVIRSWLLELTAEALKVNPDLEGIAPFVADSGEGRWTVQEAMDMDLATPVMTLALLQRFRSREREAYADKLLAIMRDKFGGHGVKDKEKS